MRCGIPLVQPVRVRAPESIAELTALQPDLGVLADYGQIVPRRAARPAAARDPQRPPVAAAAPSRRDADPGHDRGRRRPHGRDDHPDGRRHRHGPDRRPPELAARRCRAGARPRGARRARGRGAPRPDARPVARRDGAGDPTDLGRCHGDAAVPPRRRAPGSGTTARSSWSGRYERLRRGPARSSRRRPGGSSSTWRRSATPSRATSQGRWFATATASRWRHRTAGSSSIASSSRAGAPWAATSSFTASRASSARGSEPPSPGPRRAGRSA